ncbi:MAG: tyrosine--tRNA ligase [Methanomassiliicoccales archaeon]|jgi:tyrosyl-tRNA synthetase|nr:tyrosine--tRNA ligase [Methanomassiliicoccales archaeon]
MDAGTRYEIVTKNAEEVVTKEELRNLLETETSPHAYIGFEPSGLVHIGWMICANKIIDFINAGFKFTIFFADWHAFINDKLTGDVEKIRICARYMEDCFEALGIEKNKVKFRLASEIMSNISYWEKVIRIGKVSTLTRIKRAMTIMGRQEEEADLDSSKVMYPLMQAADIFELNVDVAYAGMDQRRAHMLAREAAERLGWKKPIALHTPLLPGLRGGNRMDPIASKMSKSDPDSGILIHDPPEDIKRKIGKAFCPPEVEGNPILLLYKYVIFNQKKDVTIDRPSKYGGPISFSSYDDLEKAYASSQIHPMDLKNGAGEALIEILRPVREYFERKPDKLEAMRKIIAEMR